MREKKEILEEWKEAIKWSTTTERQNSLTLAAVMEVLLDIRDLLSK